MDNTTTNQPSDSWDEFMKEPDPWVKLNEVDFSNENNQIFHVDTRDFSVMILKSEELDQYNKLPDYSEIKYIEKYLYTVEEITERLKFLLEESGGEKPHWRCLDLKHIDDKMRVMLNWNMQYIRIFRYENTDKFLVCNKSLYIIRRELFLDAKIIKEHL